MPDRERIARETVSAGRKQLAEASSRVDGLLAQLDSHHLFLPDTQRELRARRDLRGQHSSATQALKRASRALADAQRAVGALDAALRRSTAS